MLWQLQLALSGCITGRTRHPLLVDADSVRLDWSGPLEIDVETFQRAHQQAGPKGAPIDAAQARALERAVALYRGDLLEGSYQDWCLQERSRLQHCCFGMLTKLARYCVEQGEFQRGVEYCERILKQDPAHEQSHQQLMTLHFQGGDRTSALRQYERCKAALRGELGVEPSRQTRELYERMRDPAEAPAVQLAIATAGDSPDAVQHLHRLLDFVTQVEAQIKREIRLAERAVPDLTRRLMTSGQR